MSSFEGSTTGVTLAADPLGTEIRPYLLLKSACDATFMHDIGQACSPLCNFAVSGTVSSNSNEKNERPVAGSESPDSHSGLCESPCFPLE